MTTKVEQEASLGIHARLSPQYFKFCLMGWMTTVEVSLKSVVFYPQSGWLLRKEEYGNDAPLTMVIDGSELLPALNYHGGQLKEEFDKICEDLGYRYELGFCWSVHFYPKS